MDKYLIVDQIKDIQGKLDIEPYGHEHKDKIFPPDIYTYAKLVEQLINSLISLHNITPNMVSLNTIQNIQSIKDNEVQKLFVTHSNGVSKDFYVKYYDAEMDKISRLIKSHISSITNE